MDTAYDRQLAATFDRGWICVARADELEGPGAFVTRRIGTEPVVLLRNGEGTLRGHLNVCRHRGSQILQGCGHVKAMKCPYHGWMYSLDGELRGAPEMKYSECFDKGEYPLIGLEVCEWAGFAFVGFDPGSGAVAARVDGENQLDEGFVAALGRARTVESWTVEVEGDWRATLAGVATRVDATWTAAPDAHSVVVGSAADGSDVAFLLRPGLIVVAHDGGYTYMSVLPLAPRRSAILAGHAREADEPSDVALEQAKVLSALADASDAPASLTSVLDRWAQDDLYAIGG